MTTRFGSQGVQVVSSDRTYTEEDAKSPITAWQAQMRLLSFAGKNVRAWARPEKSEQHSSKVEYRHHPGLTEWFDNGVDGMEHGYTIAARPANLRDGENVSLEVALDGLKVTGQKGDDNSRALVFMDGEREVLSYSKLLVVDARGRELPATMKPTAAGFTLAYSDAQAVYPVTVDPLIVSEEAKLNRFDAAATDYFGQSVAISGDSVVVGVRLDDDGATDSGSAYVFVRSGTSWSRQGKLTAADAAIFDQFGKSVAISGDSVVVGAPAGLQFDAPGSAYVFVRSGTSWSQQKKLTAENTTNNIFFGRSVAISGDSVVVGARTREAGVDSGSAYIFVRSGTTWSPHDKLTAADAAAGDRFGWSVAISGDSLVVGAERDDDGGTDSGSVYIYRFSVPSERVLQVFDHFGVELLDGAAAAFPGLLLGSGQDFTFRLRNAGALDLDIQLVILGGVDAGQFSLTLPDISSPTDLASNQSLDYTISFNPIGSSALRNADVSIVSNNTGDTLFVFTISGLGLSDTTDGDSDGMTDWVEHSLRGFGFVWDEAQANKVTEYYDLASAAGLYDQTQFDANRTAGQNDVVNDPNLHNLHTLDEIEALLVDATFVQKDPDTGDVTIQISMEKSSDLIDYSAFPFIHAGTSVTPEGELEFTFPAPDNRSFFKLVFPE